MRSANWVLSLAAAQATQDFGVPKLVPSRSRTGCGWGKVCALNSICFIFNKEKQRGTLAGIAPEALSGQLAQLLPQLIDKITSDGKIPDQGTLQQGLGGLLQGLLGGR